MLRKNPFLIIFLATLFLLSTILLIKGLFLYRENGTLNVQVEKNDNTAVGVVNDLPDMEEYFNDDFSGETSGNYLGPDPFKDICSEVDAPKGSVVVYSNIVCFK